MAAAAQAERVTEKNAAAEEQDEDASHNTMVSALAYYCLRFVRHVISFDTLEPSRFAQVKITLIVHVFVN